MLDRIRNALARDSGERQDTPRAGPRVLLLLVAHDAPAARWDVGTLLPEEAVRGGLGGAESGQDVAAFRRALTGREGGDGLTVFDVARENGVPYAAVGLPPELAPRDARAPVSPSVEEQARAVADAAGRADWRLLVANLRLAAPAEAWDREWATLAEAVPRIRDAAPGAYHVLAFLDRATGRGDLAITGPDVPPSSSALPSIAWEDLAPTVYRALRVNVPDDLDGFPVEEAFQDEALSADDERKVQEHLEKLGYL